MRSLASLSVFTSRQVASAIDAGLKVILFFGDGNIEQPAYLLCSACGGDSELQLINLLRVPQWREVVFLDREISSSKWRWWVDLVELVVYFLHLAPCFSCAGKFFCLTDFEIVLFAVHRTADL